MKVKFTADVSVKTGTDKGAKPESYKKDQVVDFQAKYMADPEMQATHGEGLAGAASARAQASARHWINRGKAEEVVEGAKAKPATLEGSHEATPATPRGR